MNQLEFDVQRAQKRELPKETAPKLLTDVPMDPWLNTKPSMDKVKFLETRKKGKKGNYYSKLFPAITVSMELLASQSDASSSNNGSIWEWHKREYFTVGLDSPWET